MEIKSYAKIDDNMPVLVKEAIDISMDGSVFHDKMSRWCHTQGLQGAKRLHRYMSAEDRNNGIKLQHWAIDMFSVNIEPSWSYEPVLPTSIETYLNTYLEWEISVYKRISDIGNQLITKGYVMEGKKVQDCLCGVAKEIEKVRRQIQDYSKANWDWAYIRIKDQEVHDKYKDKENWED